MHTIPAATQPRRPVYPYAFGKDHHLLLLAVHGAATWGRGRLAPERLRTSAARHPALAAAHPMRGHVVPTVLAGGERRYDHDDWDALEDLLDAGLVARDGDRDDPDAVWSTTPAGTARVDALYRHTLAGHPIASFIPEEHP